MNLNKQFTFALQQVKAFISLDGRGSFGKGHSKSHHPQKKKHGKFMLNGNRVCTMCAGHWDRIRNEKLIEQGREKILEKIHDNLVVRELRRNHPDVRII